ncbi:Serine/arginine repetitive matrix protein 2 [Balamuthia mandrillaris]
MSHGQQLAVFSAETAALQSSAQVLEELGLSTLLPLKTFEDMDKATRFLDSFLPLFNGSMLASSCNCSSSSCSCSQPERCKEAELTDRDPAYSYDCDADGAPYRRPTSGNSSNSNNNTHCNVNKRQPELKDSETKSAAIIFQSYGDSWSKFSQQLHQLTSAKLQLAQHAAARGKAEDGSLAIATRNQPSADATRSRIYEPARLGEEEMDIFGYSPTSDPLLLVCCQLCMKTVKASRFSQHLDRCPRIPDDQILPRGMGAGTTPEMAKRKHPGRPPSAGRGASPGNTVKNASKKTKSSQTTTTETQSSTPGPFFKVPGLFSVMPPSAGSQMNKKGTTRGRKPKNKDTPSGAADDNKEENEIRKKHNKGSNASKGKNKETHLEKKDTDRELKRSRKRKLKIKNIEDKTVNWKVQNVLDVLNGNGDAYAVATAYGEASALTAVAGTRHKRRKRSSKDGDTVGEQMCITILSEEAARSTPSPMATRTYTRRNKLRGVIITMLPSPIPESAQHLGPLAAILPSASSPSLPSFASGLSPEGPVTQLTPQLLHVHAARKNSSLVYPSTPPTGSFSSPPFSTSNSPPSSSSSSSTSSSLSISSVASSTTGPTHPEATPAQPPATPSNQNEPSTPQTSATSKHTTSKTAKRTKLAKNQKTSKQTEPAKGSKQTKPPKEPKQPKSSKSTKQTKQNRTKKQQASRAGKTRQPKSSTGKRNQKASQKETANAPQEVVCNITTTPTPASRPPLVVPTQAQLQGVIPQQQLAPQKGLHARSSELQSHSLQQPAVAHTSTHLQQTNATPAYLPPQSTTLNIKPPSAHTQPTTDQGRLQLSSPSSIQPPPQSLSLPPTSQQSSQKPQAQSPTSQTASPQYSSQVIPTTPQQHPPPQGGQQPNPTQLLQPQQNNQEQFQQPQHTQPQAPPAPQSQQQSQQLQQQFQQTQLQQQQQQRVQQVRQLQAQRLNLQRLQQQAQAQVQHQLALQQHHQRQQQQPQQQQQQSVAQTSAQQTQSTTSQSQIHHVGLPQQSSFTQQPISPASVATTPLVGLSDFTNVSRLLQSRVLQAHPRLNLALNMSAPSFKSIGSSPISSTVTPLSSAVNNQTVLPSPGHQLNPASSVPLPSPSITSSSLPSAPSSLKPLTSKATNNTIKPPVLRTNLAPHVVPRPPSHASPIGAPAHLLFSPLSAMPTQNATQLSTTSSVPSSQQQQQQQSSSDAQKQTHPTPLKVDGQSHPIAATAAPLPQQTPQGSLPSSSSSSHPHDPTQQHHQQTTATAAAFVG